MPKKRAQEEPAGQPRLEFLVTSNPVATKDATTRAARSHVKSEYFRRKRLRDIQKYTTTLTSEEKSQEGSSNPPTSAVGLASSSGSFQQDVDEQTPETVQRHGKGISGRTEECPLSLVGEGQCYYNGKHMIKKVGSNAAIQNSLVIPIRLSSGQPAPIPRSVWLPLLFPNANDVYVDYYFFELDQLQAHSQPVSEEWHNQFGSWFSATYACEPLFHASAADTAANLSGLNGTGVSAQSLMSRGEAIRTTNLALDDPQTQTADETIAAVIGLAHFEFITGDTQAFIHHVNGLKQMINMRGGLEQVTGFNGFLAQATEEYDRLLALLCPTSPILLPSSKRTCPSTAFPTQHALWDLSQSTRTTFEPTVDRMLTCMYNTFKEWHALSNESNETSTDDDEQTRGTYFATSCHHLYTSLVSITVEDDPTPAATQTPWTPLRFGIEACRLTGLIFAARGIQSSCPHSTPTPLPFHPIRTLQSHLKNSKITSFWGLYPGAVLWCLLVGSSEEEPSFARDWFRVQVTRTLMAGGIWWSHTRRSLEVFVWLVRCVGAGRVVGC
ncbi:MAG: hypothetical protein M1834_002461 [Cirrosporium novae-zelandiae]|nr:MAG: hypothetical protein M1834_002461 [Cirrosporium novae-zelandiae]